MSIAVVYYSQSGNTDRIARRLADSLGATLLRLEPAKAYPDSGFKKFFWGGKSAVMGESPELLPYEFPQGGYDLVVFGSPIWAGTFTPPLRSFIRENRAALEGKTFAAFFCSGGGSTAKGFEKLKSELGIERFRAELSLNDPAALDSPETDEKLSSFCSELA